MKNTKKIPKVLPGVKPREHQLKLKDGGFAVRTGFRDESITSTLIAAVYHLAKTYPIHDVARAVGYSVQTVRKMVKAHTFKPCE